MHASEITWYRNLSHHVCSRYTDHESTIKKVSFGANIETLRAAITAGTLAKTADFFSLGTNDLIQYTWALDQDSGAADVIDPYIYSNIFSEPIREYRPRRCGFL